MHAVYVLLWLVVIGTGQLTIHRAHRFLHSFSYMEIIEFWFQYHWNLFSRHWFRLCLGTEEATRHFLNQRWLSLLTYICITRPHWVRKWHRALQVYYDVLLIIRQAIRWSASNYDNHIMPEVFELRIKIIMEWIRVFHRIWMQWSITF